MPQQPNARLAHQKAGRSASPRVTEVLSTEHHELRRPSAPQPGPAGPAQPQPGPQVRTASTQQQQRSTQKAVPQVTAATPRTDADNNSDYMSIDLPSGFAFYPFKKLVVRPLRAIDQAKLYRAASTNNLRFTVEALGATIGEGVSAMDLTPQDFYYLMYWQRTESFLKTPMVVKGKCQNEQHQEDVMLGRKVTDDQGQETRVPIEEKTLDLTVTVNKTTLEVKNLELDPGFDTAIEFPSIHELGLGVETMADLVWASEHLATLESLMEAEWIAGYAAFIATRPDAKLLSDRMKLIEHLSPDQIAEFDTYITRVTTYGVRESTNIKCMECGAQTEVVIPLDARTFLPDRQRG